jgi:amino-acid N-acetyltransferase
LRKKLKARKVEKMEAKDLSAAQELLSKYDLPTDGLDETELWCVRRDDRGVIGIAGLETWERQGLLRSVVVESNYRKSGVGRALVEHTLEEAMKRHLVELFLLTETASHFFGGFGFKPFKRKNVTGDILRSAEFREACPDTASVMRLALSVGGRPKL